MSIRQKIINLVEHKLEHPSKRKRNRLREKGLDITFTIWWWIAKRIEYRKELDYVCYKLAIFYSKKIDSFIGLHVTDIVVLNKTIFVYLRRPGFMIGKGGENIDKLTDFINTNVYGEKIYDYRISIIEDLKSWNSMFFNNLRYV